MDEGRRGNIGYVVVRIYLTCSHSPVNGRRRRHSGAAIRITNACVSTLSLTCSQSEQNVSIVSGRAVV